MMYAISLSVCGCAAMAISTWCIYF
jgi:hypothetical protein